MSSRRAYALQLGGYFLLLNVLRVSSWRPFYKQRLRSLREVASDPAVLEQVGLIQEIKVPEYITEPVTSLSDAQKKTIRAEFYAYSNMPTTLLYHWLKDPRVRDGCGRRPFEVMNHRVRLRELIHLKSTTRRDGTGWSPRHYETARQCVFVYQTIFSRRVIDYPLWAILRNYGLDWGRRDNTGWSHALPRSVRFAALRALVRYQKPGKRRKQRVA